MSAMVIEKEGQNMRRKLNQYNMNAAINNEGVTKYGNPYRNPGKEPSAVIP